MKFFRRRWTESRGEAYVFWDEFGGLSDQPLDLDDFTPYEIDAASYEQVITGLRRRTA